MQKATISIIKHLKSALHQNNNIFTEKKMDRMGKEKRKGGNLSMVSDANGGHSPLMLDPLMWLCILQPLQHYKHPNIKHLPHKTKADQNGKRDGGRPEEKHLEREKSSGESWVLEAAEESFRAFAAEVAHILSAISSQSGSLPLASSVMMIREIGEW